MPCPRCDLRRGMTPAGWAPEATEARLVSARVRGLKGVVCVVEEPSEKHRVKLDCIAAAAPPRERQERRVWE